MKKEELFNKIVAENSDRIRRICAFYNANTHDQQDMCQEVLVNIWNSLDNFRGESAVSTWIYRIAVNTSLQYTGKAFKNMKLIVNADTGILSNVLDDEELSHKQLEEEQFENLQRS